MRKSLIAGTLVLGLVAVGCDDGDEPTEAPAAVEVEDAADAAEQEAETKADEVEENADEVEASLRADD